ncbi:hypothetical protein OIU84_007800 [Salix udensis]|uniref:Small ribosomal subunit protein uS10 domain-containing protein n=1 Tax=Salix udensis TaxID=889485 RepID=A0AAD6NZV8_9ROSI|nr:hypothetical protein OIU84_007800 [Salix udensis]
MSRQRQAKNLVSIFSSRISSFSYSQSRSFTAAPPPPPSVFVDKKVRKAGTKMPAISSSSGRNAGGHQEEKPPKAMTTKICIAIRSFEDLVPGNTISGLPADVRKIRLPESRVLYTVLRSPHVDKKSREQFEMRMKKQLLVAKVQSHELRQTPEIAALNYGIWRKGRSSSLLRFPSFNDLLNLQDFIVMVGIHFPSLSAEGNQDSIKLVQGLQREKFNVLFRCPETCNNELRMSTSDIGHGTRSWSPDLLVSIHCQVLPVESSNREAWP